MVYFAFSSLRTPRYCELAHYRHPPQELSWVLFGVQFFFSPWVCAWGVCECVYVCLRHVGYPWRLEINIRCSTAVHLLYWGLVSQLNLELANSACMASQFALGIFCLHFPITEIRGWPPCHPNIIRMLGICTQGIMIERKLLDPSHFHTSLVSNTLFWDSRAWLSQMPPGHESMPMPLLLCEVPCSTVWSAWWETVISTHWSLSSVEGPLLFHVS